MQQRQLYSILLAVSFIVLAIIIPIVIDDTVLRNIDFTKKYSQLEQENTENEKQETESETESEGVLNILLFNHNKSIVLTHFSKANLISFISPFYVPPKYI
jgi:hypothetical protein